MGEVIWASCTILTRFNAYYRVTMIMDYDNDGSDNCDYNFVTFDDFGVKNDQKVYT